MSYVCPHFVFVMKAMRLCVCVKHQQTGELTTDMINGYLRYNVLKMEGILKKKRARALLHYHCVSLPLIYNRRCNIVPSESGLFLQKVAKVSQTNSRVWKCLANVKQVSPVVISSAIIPPQSGATNTNLSNDEMKLLEAECSKQGESKYKSISYTGKRNISELTYFCL